MHPRLDFPFRPVPFRLRRWTGAIATAFYYCVSSRLPVSTHRSVGLGRRDFLDDQIRDPPPPPPPPPPPRAITAPAEEGREGGREDRWPVIWIARGTKRQEGENKNGSMFGIARSFFISIRFVEKSVWEGQCILNSKMFPTSS